ncbi:MAG: serine/threonine protein phosphatase [Lachnospiraceae bacterium]|nr:serine/threonine protein phosphatase [Lachnospiraceae bacterium]MBR4183397.1 serine/threonine protein phosphatase [Lachnospiraceae bacterium]
MKTKIKNFIKENRFNFFLMLYFIPYMIWFEILEHTVTDDFHVIHMNIDDKIPFCEYFIVPYYMWFGYVAIAFIYLLFINSQEYRKMCIYLYTGMTLFLIISTIYPNGAYLRPTSFVNDNIFTDLVKGIYSVDTQTNLFPSIHVYNSIGVHIAVSSATRGRKERWPVVILSFIIALSISASTLFVKQHSMFDVITAVALNVIMYILVYARPGRVQTVADAA